MLRGRVRWLVLWSLWACRLVRQPLPAVRLAGGSLVRGQIAPDGSHHQYFGIPYTTLGPARRFQAPGPEPEWVGVLEAVNEHVRCPQLFGQLVVGSDECLVLNVYRPAFATDAGKLPVMVYVHGGGFLEGAGSRLLYGPDYLVARGVLLVTFNYRLNSEGFLCLRTRAAPGNAGLKDQLAALRWVRRNINVFGGDPENITIFGESAGAASVSLHLVSRASRGLFRRAIAQSGSSIGPWVMQAEPVRMAMKVAAALGSNASSSEELDAVFAAHSSSQLLRARVLWPAGQVSVSRLTYVPCIERAIEGVEPFLLEQPLEILQRGEINDAAIIIGANSEEGYYFAAMEDKENFREINFEQSLPLDLEFPSLEDKESMARNLSEFYSRDSSIPASPLGKMSRLHGDPFFLFPAAEESRLISNAAAGPVYTYLFSYAGWRNFAKLISGPAFWFAGGASHADDLFYLFRLFPVPSLFENAMIDRMTVMWSNFAKYGDPTPEESALVTVRWPRADLTGQTLHIDSALSVTQLGELPRVQIWRRMYHCYRKLYGAGIRVNPSISQNVDKCQRVTQQA